MGEVTGISWVPTAVQAQPTRRINEIIVGDDRFRKDMGRDRDTARPTLGQAWLFRRFRGTCPFSLVHSSRFRAPPLSSRTVASRESGWRP